MIDFISRRIHVYALTLLYLGVLSSCSQTQEPVTDAAEEQAATPSITTVYSPQGNAPGVGSMYPRILKVQYHEETKGDLLVTFEHYMNREPSFPIYRSTDNGATWSLSSEVEDLKNDFGMRYQPHLFELPQQVGEFPAGTIMATGSSIPSDFSSTELLVYYSTDGGYSWEYLSSIVEGGRAIYPNDGETPVWEPFLGLDNQGRLVAYYSDERFYDDDLDQILAHKVSGDGGRTWGEVVYDVAVPDGDTRPGMPIVTKLPNGKYMMIFEIVGRELVPVHYKLSDDGLDWGDPADLGTLIVSEEGYKLKSTPYVIWVPVGGDNGTIIASGMSVNMNGTLVGDGYFINRNLGEGPWTHISGPIKYPTDQGPAGYSQSMVPLNDQGNELIGVIPIPNGNARNMDIKAVKFKLPTE